MISSVSFAYQSVGLAYVGSFFGIAASAHQAWSANFFTIVSDMFPKSCTASVFEIGGFAGAIGSIILAKVAGLLFDHYKRLGHLETGILHHVFCMWICLPYNLDGHI